MTVTEEKLPLVLAGPSTSAGNQRASYNSVSIVSSCDKINLKKVHINI